MGTDNRPSLLRTLATCFLSGVAAGLFVLIASLFVMQQYVTKNSVDQEACCASCTCCECGNCSECGPDCETCVKPEKEPEEKPGDVGAKPPISISTDRGNRVLVTKGFYQGRVGVLIAHDTETASYVVQLDGLEGNRSVPEGMLELWKQTEGNRNGWIGPDDSRLNPTGSTPIGSPIGSTGEGVSGQAGPGTSEIFESDGTTKAEKDGPPGPTGPARHGKVGRCH